jgi:hypothetical protein
MAKGGLRFGAGRPGHRAVGETLHRVDVRLWAQRGYMDSNVERSFNWMWTCNGERSGSIEVQVTRERVILSYRLRNRTEEWQEHHETVAIERTECRFGGARCWFRCPHCGRRCELLYLRFGRFACRHCNRVSYGSQSGGLYDRLLHKFHKLRKRVECGRPKGVHQRTWEALLNRTYELEEVVDSLLGARIAHLYAAAGISPNDTPADSA